MFTYRLAKNLLGIYMIDIITGTLSVSDFKPIH